MVTRFQFLLGCLGFPAAARAGKVSSKVKQQFLSARTTVNALGVVNKALTRKAFKENKAVPFLWVSWEDNPYYKERLYGFQLLASDAHSVTSDISIRNPVGEKSLGDPLVLASAAWKPIRGQENLNELWDVLEKAGFFKGLEV